LQASWKLEVQEGKQIEGLKLIFIQCRKQRLALWAAGRGAGGSSESNVKQAIWKLAAQEGKQIEGLKL